MVRSYYIDKLKVTLTVFIIAYHGVIPYAPLGGGWMVDNVRKIPYVSPVIAIGSTFFMSLFFFISGFFVVDSLNRKGLWQYIIARVTRLGLPAIFFSFFCLGPMAYFVYGGNQGIWAFLHYLYGNGWQPLYGHLWFIIHLLIYNLGFALWRQIRPYSPPAKTGPDGKLPLPDPGRIIGFIVALALVSWLVRIWYPVGKWVGLFVFIPTEVSHLPLYLTLFSLGVMTGRNGWQEAFPARSGFVWLGLGLAAAVAYYIYRLTGQGPFFGLIAPGGFNWPSLVWSCWESLMCVSFCLGFTVLFRELFSAPAKGLMALLAPNAYGAYIFHMFIVLGLQMLLVSAPLNPLVKFILVFAVAVPVSFSLTHLVRLMAWARLIF